MAIVPMTTESMTTVSIASVPIAYVAMTTVAMTVVTMAAASVAATEAAMEIAVQGSLLLLLLSNKMVSCAANINAQEETT